MPCCSAVPTELFRGWTLTTGHHGGTPMKLLSGKSFLGCCLCHMLRPLLCAAGSRWGPSGAAQQGREEGDGHRAGQLQHWWASKACCADIAAAAVLHASAAWLVHAKAGSDLVWYSAQGLKPARTVLFCRAAQGRRQEAEPCGAHQHCQAHQAQRPGRTCCRQGRHQPLL